MPRYYFNVFDGQDVFDKVGVELADGREARKHMISVAMDHIENHADHHEPWQMEALDDEGRIVGTMDFGLDSSKKD